MHILFIVLVTMHIIGLSHLDKLDCGSSHIHVDCRITNHWIRNNNHEIVESHIIGLIITLIDCRSSHTWTIGSKIIVIHHTHIPTIRNYYIDNKQKVSFT